MITIESKIKDIPFRLSRILNLILDLILKIFNFILNKNKDT